MQQMIMTDAHDVYRRQGVLTASPMELIIMLYDGLRKDMLIAERAIKKDDAAQAHHNLVKAQDIVNELINCLDLSLSISKDLLALYEFILHELEAINVAKDAERIPPLLEIIGTLRDTWQEISVGNKGSLYLEEE